MTDVALDEARRQESVESRRSRQFIAGDPLRALAALGVFLFHVAIYGGPGTSAAFGSSVQRVLGGLDIGVWTFFILSGYLLGRPFADALAEGKLPRVGAFLRNRIRRLGPGLVALVVVTLVVQGLNGAAWWRPIQAGLFAQVYAGSSFSTQMAQAWTLDAEMMFYLLLPIFFGAIMLARQNTTATRRGRTALLLAGLIALASLAIRAGIGNDVSAERLPPEVMFGFVPGLLAAILEPSLRHRSAQLSTASIGGVAVLGVLILGVGSTLPAQPVVARSIAAVVGCGLIVGGALLWEWGGRRAIRLLDNAALQWLGRRSYSFYLFQLIVIVKIATAFDGIASPKVRLLAIIAVALAATLLVAEVSYRIVEEPFLRRKEAWRASPASER
jgi:peptidoglycan/LPS O-acetylase OafA/YrhL